MSPDLHHVRARVVWMSVTAVACRSARGAEAAPGADGRGGCGVRGLELRRGAVVFHFFGGMPLGHEVAQEEAAADGKTVGPVADAAVERGERFLKNDRDLQVLGFEEV